MDFDDETGDFFGEDELFGDTDVVGDDEAIEDNRYDGVKGGGKDEISDFLKKEKKETARKKTNPLALLNERSLVGKSGIQLLKESFTNYKPNPKADPYSQLPELLKKYQHWAHVLAPRMKFEDVISRCEQLGEKRSIKVYMAKIRMGMPLTDEDFETTGSRKRRNSDDRIITTEYASDRERSFSPPPKGKSISPPPKRAEPSQPRSMFGPATTSTSSVVPIVPSVSTPLTEEQRRKIAENRLKAMELRSKREAEERERIEKEKREEEIPPEAMEEFPTFDEDEIMAQFDDFE
uniref:TIMELESS-interacting protein n=1 Tax=Pristionchus pacificus TaxID=54126 RepID=A0A8R1V3Q5_PRIPA